jgi:hypothetical protein
VRLKDLLDRLLGTLQLGERALLERGREPSGQQQRILVAQRNLELLG